MKRNILKNEQFPVNAIRRKCYSHARTHASYAQTRPAAATAVTVSFLELIMMMMMMLYNLQFFSLKINLIASKSKETVWQPIKWMPMLTIDRESEHFFASITGKKMKLFRAGDDDVAKLQNTRF